MLLARPRGATQHVSPQSGLRPMRRPHAALRRPAHGVGQVSPVKGNIPYAPLLAWCDAQAGCCVAQTAPSFTLRIWKFAACGGHTPLG